VASWYASLYGSVGITHLRLGRLDKARANLERGRVLAEDLPNDDYGQLIRRGIASELASLVEAEKEGED